jgi:hypothetical protein
MTGKCRKKYKDSESTVDYTIIKDMEIRTKICGLMSEMLDNPNKCWIILINMEYIQQVNLCLKWKIIVSA